MTFYKVQPITDFTIFTTPPSQRKGVQFKASWATTEKELARELDSLDATDAVLEIAVQPHHVKVDGRLRSNTPKTLPHPGVRLSFWAAHHGPLSFTCDTYEVRYYGQMADWQANLRAIVLTLESLRAVDRHGATKGEQYAGLRAIGAGTGATAMGGMTWDAARDILLSGSSWSGRTDWQGWGDSHAERKLYRSALANAHPDRNAGDRTAWDLVEQAGRVLGLDS